MWCEPACIDRTARSGFRKRYVDLLTATADAPAMHQAITSAEFRADVGGFPPKRMSALFDINRFGDSRCFNHNDGTDRLEQGSEQGVCKSSIDLVRPTHQVCVFDNTSSNPPVSARYLPACLDLYALNEQTPARSGRMTLSGCKKSLGRRQ